MSETAAFPFIQWINDGGSLEPRSEIGGFGMPLDQATMLGANIPGDVRAIHHRSGNITEVIFGAAFSIIVPARSLAELSRIAKRETGSVEIIVPPTRNTVFFQVADIVLASQLVEGAFPGYQQIIPTEWMTRTVIDRAAFLRACKKSDVVSEQRLCPRQWAHRAPQDRAGIAGLHQRSVGGGHAPGGIGDDCGYQPWRHPARG